MYRWLNVAVDWNGSVLRIWINNALTYNGTPPAAATTFTALQGFRITFTPIDADTVNITLYYQRYKYNLAQCNCLWVRDWVVWDRALSLTAVRGRVSWWSGWVRMINVPVPRYGESGFTRTIHVLPPAPYLGGDRRLFGAVTPFLVRSLTALRASNGTVFASYADENGAVKMLTFTTPNGTFYVEEPLRGAVPEGFKQVVYIYAEGPYAAALGFEYKKISGRYYWVPFIHTSDDVECWFRGNWPYSGVLCRVLGKWSVEIAWSIDGNGVVSVYRDGALQRRTRLGQLSAALAWTRDGRMCTQRATRQADFSSSRNLSARVLSPYPVSSSRLSDPTKPSSPILWGWFSTACLTPPLRLYLRRGRGGSAVHAKHRRFSTRRSGWDTPCCCDTARRKLLLSRSLSPYPQQLSSTF
jgi:hypothetical protein